MTSDARRDAARLADLLRTEHHAMAEFLLALADFDHRRGWAALGHASLWAFLHHDLGLSARPSRRCSRRRWISCWPMRRGGARQ